MEEQRPIAERKTVAPSLRAKLYRYRQLLKRLWWVPLLGVSIALSVQGYLISQEKPAYISQARMWVSGKVSLPEGGMYREEVQNFFGTQIELMKSELIQTRAHARTKLLNPKLEQGMVQLKVVQAPRAAVFILQAVGAEPLYTRAFLQALMDEYLSYKKELRQGASTEALSAITEQVYRPQKELKEAQEALHSFQTNNNLVMIETQGSSAGSYLAKLNTRLSDLKAEAQMLELLASNESGDPSKLLSGNGEAKATDLASQMAAYQKIRESLNVLKNERQDLAQYLKDKHPKIIRLDEEISRQERLMEMVRQQSREQLLSSRQSIKLQIQNYEQLVREWEVKAQEASRKMADFDRLKGNLARVESLYNRLLTTAQNVGVSQHLEQENVSVMEHAAGAAPIRVAVLRKLSGAFFLGLLCSLAILYFVDRHDDRISSVSELMQHFDQPVLGHVPSVPVRKGSRLEPVHAHDQRASFVEAFRDIRSALLFAADKGVRPKTLLVSSAIPN